jgi:hypothetical protein
MRKLHLSSLGLLLVLAGCNVCGPIARFAIEVAPVDALSRQPLAEGAVLVIRDGTYVDSATIINPPLGTPPILVAGFDRPGTYDVLVRRENYLPWTREGVRVTRGGACRDLRSVELIAELERAPLTAR